MESIRIIIIEDEAIIAAEIKSTLGLLGYEVVGHAMSGDYAMSLFDSKEFDLVILDINIKGSMDGVSLGKILKEQYQVPFIYLTSFSDKTTLQRVKETMPYGYIVKPFNENDLRSNIELALYKFQQETQTLNLAIIESKFEVLLNEREFEILEKLIAGKKYKDIAESIFLSINTIKAYQKKLYLKFKVTSKFELMEKFKAYI